MRSLSMVIPALNEERNIVLTVEGILPFARQHLDRFELILVNDGSTDGTGEAAEGLARKYPEVSVIQHQQRRGVGLSYREGIDRARMEYVTLIPGDNVCDPRTWSPLFEAIGDSHLVIGSRANQRDSRQLYRVLLSAAFTWTMCRIYGIRLKDFQGLVVYPTGVVRTLNLQSTGYTYQLEMLVQLHRRGFKMRQTPLYMIPEETRSSRSLRLKTVFDLINTMWRLARIKEAEADVPLPAPDHLHV